MWLFIGCGLRDLFPLLGSLSVLVTVRLYAGGPSAVVSLLGYFLLVWFVGSLCGIVSGPVRCMKSGGGNFSYCAVDVLRLGVSYSSVAEWAYVKELL
jgi:hypothetical protein